MAIEQFLGHRADRFELLEPERQRIRHFGSAHSFRAGRVRQQQAGFEIGQPRRHHQIIGRELQAQAPRLVDENQVLVGERQDRNLGEVDLLLAGEREQQIERTFEALDVDDQGALVGPELGRQIGVELHDIRRHQTLASLPATLAIMRANSARAAAKSSGAGARRAASAASARAPARPESSGAALATASISARLPLQCSAISQPAASAARVRSAIVPDKAPIERSSLISKPSNPMNPRITCAMIVAEVVAGSSRSIAVNTTWAVIPIPMPASGRNAAKSLDSSVVRSASTTGRR